MNKHSVSVKREQEVRPDTELWNGSRILLEKAEQDPKGSYYLIMSSIVLAGFALEAYLNHVSHLILSGKKWNEIERKPPLDKLDILCKKFNLTLSDLYLQFDTIIEVFSFRDQMAHGKTKTLNENNEVPLSEFSEPSLNDQLKAEWQQYCSEENAKRAREDIKMVAELIGEKARMQDKDPTHNYYPFVSGIGIAVASLKSR